MANDRRTPRFVSAALLAIVLTALPGRGARPGTPRLGERAGRGNQQARSPLARLPVRGRGQRGDARAGEVAVLPAAQRPVEVPVLREPGVAAGHVLRDRVRRLALEDDPGARQHRDAGLRAAAVREHRVRLGLERAAEEHPGSRRRRHLLLRQRLRLRHEPAPAHPARPQLRRLVPAPVRGPGLVERPPRAHHVRRRLGRLLPVGQRPKGRLQRGQPRAGRVRPDRLRQARREPARRRGLSLHGRLVPRVPGLLAHVGHLPRRDPLVDGARARGRLPRGDGPRRAVPRREAEDRRDPGQRDGRVAEGLGRGGAARRVRTVGARGDDGRDHGRQRPARPKGSPRRRPPAPARPASPSRPRCRSLVCGPRRSRTSTRSSSR